MKCRFKIFLLLICMSFSLCKIHMIQADSNMNGGGSGGGTQSGTSQNSYSSGDDGVRITILDVKTKARAEGTKTIDYYRIDKGVKSIVHFGKVCKLEYMGLGGFAVKRELLQSAQKYLVDSNGRKVAYQVSDLPTIVSSSASNSDIEEIKDFFNNEDRLRGIASRTGIAYDNLISGQYKIVIEPMIYLTFQGKYLAMSAHEAAKLDIALGGSITSGGALRAKFVSFTHKNLPLAIFLKKKDLGIKPWTGSKYNRVSNGNILSYLGVGILGFAPQGNEVDLDTGRYVYRPNTDVITSLDVSVVDGSPDGATCDAPISVQFYNRYFGTITKTGITVPQGGSRPVWIKWRTPNVTERTLTEINVQVTGGAMSSVSASIPITISPLSLKEPENPLADDRKPRSFAINSEPKFPTTAALSKFSEVTKHRTWHTYTCVKHKVLDHYEQDESGKEVPVFRIEYDYYVNNYSSSIVSTIVKVTRDRNCQHANPDKNKIKSGYGIEVNVTSNISGASDACTGIQHFCAYFPEYNYKKYRRDGKLPGASMLSTIELPVNLYSLKSNRVHFTPIWFPDGKYEVYVETFDAWTPAGMLCDIGKASIELKGSMWDDWHIQTVKG